MCLLFGKSPAQHTCYPTLHAWSYTQVARADLESINPDLWEHTMGAWCERKFRRFDLSYPVHVKFASGESTVEVDAVSRNVSLGGLLLDSKSPIPYGSQVEFTITLGGAIPRLIILGGTGEVVRVDQWEQESRFGIAVACAQPIHQIESYLG